MKIHASSSHPRFLSNYYRDVLAQGVKDGLTSLQGLTAHGRGEAFDYLIGEKTQSFAHLAIETAACHFLLSEFPVISTNGNSTILVPKEIVTLSKTTGAKIEINLFHASKSREKKIKKLLEIYGAKDILLPDETCLKGVSSNRKMISAKGQKKADVILVPLEDGDRTEALVRSGKKVITIDLNPLSRTAKNAHVTIVDNIVRALPLLIQKFKDLKSLPKKDLLIRIKNFDNQKNLSLSCAFLSQRLAFLSKQSEMMIL